MLKAKICNDGYLKVERRGEFSLQNCPRLPDGDCCGDHCVMFGEVENVVISINPATHKTVSGNTLTICEGRKFEVVK
jgi:hypothetical protein